MKFACVNNFSVCNDGGNIKNGKIIIFGLLKTTSNISDQTYVIKFHTC